MFSEPGPAALLRQWTARYAISIPSPCAAGGAALTSFFFFFSRKMADCNQL